MEDSKILLIFAIITFATSIYMFVTQGFTLYVAFLYMIGCVVALLSSITYHSKVLYDLKNQFDRHERNHLIAERKTHE